MGNLHCLRFAPWYLPRFYPWLDSSFFSFTNGGVGSSSWNEGTSTFTITLLGHGYGAARNCGMPDYSCLS